MAKEIVLEEIEKQSDAINMYFRINGNPFVLSYRFRTIGCDPIDVDRIEGRFDSSVITMIYFALTQGYDFRSDYPISPELHFNLTEQFVPQLLRVAKTAEHKSQRFFARHDVKIHAPLLAPPPSKHEHWVGTGISCGVDSLSAIYEYSQLCKIPGRQLTHLVCMKTGMHHGEKNFNFVRENRLFRAELDRVYRFINDTKFPLLIIDTNLWEFLMDAFGSVGYDRQHTLRSCGTITLLKDYFSLYYFADGTGLETFNVDTSHDCAYYERWFLPLISTSSLQFYSSDGGGKGRFGKTKILSEYPPSYDNLHVCWISDKNCGVCGKCIRTLVALDILGVLDRYKNTFDIDAYRKNRVNLIKRVIRFRHRNNFFAELYAHMPDDMKNLA